ncbi:hypothetical protein CEH05_07020 [Halobacillus halophilus]|uniref:hypothetical protein n=1 Tax=Halobacillus halophilus TaxID=1570 RepID=UPI0005A21622|nr:hypothetical protein [Halobacillus halophilus]ASF38877.1 hypothetical protein CEH05_07020 [Halobacillus halophilus]
MSSGYEYYHIPKIACERIDIFTKLKPGKFEHFNETNYYTIKRFPHPELGILTFAFVHFPSKLHMDDFDHGEESRIFKKEVEDVEGQCKSNKTVLVGDFNMNPFEQGMMAASAINSYPTKYEASKVQRKVKSRSYNMFYNPMWNFLGIQVSLRVRTIILLCKTFKSILEPI